MFLFQHLTNFPDVFEPVAFEQNFWFGGVWRYTDRTENDDFGLPVHSAMYNNLKLVLKLYYELIKERIID